MPTNNDVLFILLYARILTVQIYSLFQCLYMIELFRFLSLGDASFHELKICSKGF
jgi:hypothetical protein